MIEARDEVVDRSMPDVPTFLTRIRERPGMYLGRKTVDGLHHLLIGIRLAEDLHRIPPTDRFRGFDFQGFEAWVDARFNGERLRVNSFWLAGNLAGSDTAGFDRWFQWYDEFNAAANHQ